MYAVIKSGGKQYKVTEGQVLQVERLGVEPEASVELQPVMVVDGTSVLATPDELSSASVVAKVLGATKGPKITGFTYKNKSNQRKRWGHRQGYDTVEITSIKGS